MLTAAHGMLQMQCKQKKGPSLPQACQEILLGVHSVLKKKRGLSEIPIPHRALIIVGSAETAVQLKKFADRLAQPLKLPQGPGMNTSTTQSTLRAAAGQYEGHSVQRVFQLTCAFYCVVCMPPVGRLQGLSLYAPVENFGVALQ